MFSTRPPSLRRLRLVQPPRCFSVTIPCPGRRCIATVSSSQQKLQLNRKKWVVAGGLLGASTLVACLWTCYRSEGQPFLSLSPARFSPTVVTSSETIGSNTKLIRLKVSPEVAAGIGGACPMWSVYVKNSDIQIERPYTPLEGLKDSGELEFWIKSYPDGEMGRWLHTRRLGETVEIRGPEQTWNSQTEAWDNIIMISGGTGVAPFLQLLHTYFTDEKKERRTKFTLLQSYRSPSELPPAKFLDKLGWWCRHYPGNLKVQTFVDSVEAGMKTEDYTVRRINRDDLWSILNNCRGKTAVLVCGPDSMIDAFAGVKALDQSQGTIKGLLGELQHRFAFDVWKL